jgi:hypothetical protein
MQITTKQLKRCYQDLKITLYVLDSNSSMQNETTHVLVEFILHK